MKIQILDTIGIRVHFVHTVSYSDINIRYRLNISGVNVRHEASVDYMFLFNHSEAGEVSIDFKIQPGFLYKVEVGETCRVV